MDQRQQLNTNIRGWARDTIGDLKAQFARLNIQHAARSPSAMSSHEQLINRFGTRQGMVSRIGFVFPRHMVFVAKGVGKGVPAYLAGSSYTTREPKDWFNSVMEEGVEDLADIAAEGAADIAVEKLFIK